MKPLEETLKHEEAPEVTKVLCIGGSSRIPGIRKRLEELCPDATVLCKMDPDQAIAIGAANIAGTLKYESLNVNKLRIVKVDAHDKIDHCQ